MVEGDRLLRGMQPGEGCQQVLPPLVVTVPAVQPTDARPADGDQREQQPQPHVPGLLIPLAQPGVGLVAAAEQAGHRRLVQHLKDRLGHPQRIRQVVQQRDPGAEGRHRQQRSRRQAPLIRMDQTAEHHPLLVAEGQHARQPAPHKRILLGQPRDLGPRGKAWQVVQEQVPQPQPKDPTPALGGSQLTDLDVEPARPQGRPDDRPEVPIIHEGEGSALAVLR
jgi:hypothetical protein